MDAPVSPHRVLDRVQAELHLAHAGDDRSMPPEQVERPASCWGCSGGA